MPPSPLLELERISKRFGNLLAVDALSFGVHAGEVFGFLGPNGAGKTTTLRMVMDITSPDEGRVLFGGSAGIDRGRVGYLPEDRGLYPDAPVLDTLVYLGELRGMRAGDARQAAGAWLERLDLADRAGDKVGKLSKGNQQKVQLAGAVLHRPALAVLDEPFSGLDPLNQELAMRIMRELCEQGTAVLLSAHQLDLVERLADRFLLISRGRALFGGTLEEVRRAATGGADLVVRVDLSPRAGLDPVERAVAAVIPEARFEREALRDGRQALEIAVPPERDLAPLLAAVAAQAVVHSVDTQRLPLHELYVRAVESDRGARRMLADEVVDG
jgi:ABC-2 type transport system ATP-binding protein